MKSSIEKIAEIINEYNAREVYFTFLVILCAFGETMLYPDTAKR